jgi:head-tail adaptor
MSDAIGALRARVKLQSPTRIADELGGAAIHWADEGDVWAEVEAGAASESAAFDTAPSVANFRVTIHRRASPGVAGACASSASPTKARRASH